jgi:hypothetical protein
MDFTFVSSLCSSYYFVGLPLKSCSIKPQELSKYLRRQVQECGDEDEIKIATNFTIETSCDVKRTSVIILQV